MTVPDPANVIELKSIYGTDVAIDTSRDFMGGYRWDRSIVKLPWRTVRIAASLDEAERLAYRGIASKWQCAEAAVVRYDRPLDIASPAGSGSTFAKVLLAPPDYWAAPVEIVAIPRATYFPESHLVVSAASQIWEELDYNTDLFSQGLLPEKGNRLRFGPWHQKVAEAAPRIPGTTSLIGAKYHKNYTHWHTEVLSAFIGLQRERPVHARNAFQFLENFRRRTLEVSEIATAKDIELTGPAYHFEVALFFTHCLFRIWLHPSIGDPLKVLAERARAKIAAASANRAPVYISRLDASARPMTNESELCAALQSVGVDVVTAAGMSYDEQVAAFARANLVIGPHGSGLTNMIYCLPGTPVVELRPMHAHGRSPFWDISYRILATIMGLPYGMLVFENSPDSDPWEVDIPLVLATIANFRNRA